MILEYQSLEFGSSEVILGVSKSIRAGHTHLMGFHTQKPKCWYRVLNRQKLDTYKNKLVEFRILFDITGEISFENPKQLLVLFLYQGNASKNGDHFTRKRILSPKSFKSV